MTDVERLLHYALAPVEPPTGMSERFERRLTELTDLALDEIAEWDPSALRSPRRWARVAAAGVVAGAGAGTLVLVRARQRHKRGDVAAMKALGRGRSEVAAHVRKRLGR
ncbi:MAG: hypothetical protein QOJ07_1475 [Thermoleophilaceae bacterium]|jgi:hypothetical protein|nr:hypothetical protein [Thermoleophilaceae bacterium]